LTTRQHSDTILPSKKDRLKLLFAEIEMEVLQPLIEDEAEQAWQRRQEERSRGEASSRISPDIAAGWHGGHWHAPRD